MFLQHLVQKGSSGNFISETYLLVTLIAFYSVDGRGLAPKDQDGDSSLHLMETAGEVRARRGIELPFPYPRDGPILNPQTAAELPAPRLRRQAAAAPAAPTAAPPPTVMATETPRPDELEARTQAPPDNSAYPKIITPNVTCMTYDDITRRKRRVKPTPNGKKLKKCPKKFPCKHRNSCSIWKIGLVTKQFSLDEGTARVYYDELFEFIHPKKMEEVYSNFFECTNRYALSTPFQGDEAGESESGVAHEHSKKKKKHNPNLTAGRRRRRETIQEHENMVKSRTEGTTEKTADDGDGDVADPHFGLRDCQTRIEDFLECFEVALMKAMCYWPRLTATQLAAIYAAKQSRA